MTSTRAEKRVPVIILVSLILPCAVSLSLEAQSRAARVSGTDLVLVLDEKAAGGFYRFVGQEMQKYVGRLTGTTPEIIDPSHLEQHSQNRIPILIGGPDVNPLTQAAVSEGQVSFQGLKPEGFILESIAVKGTPALIIGGNDEAGTMYGAYDWLERQGIVFQLSGDILPEQTRTLSTVVSTFERKRPFLVEGVS